MKTPPLPDTKTLVDRFDNKGPSSGGKRLASNATARLARLTALADADGLSASDREIILWAAAELRYAIALKYAKRAWDRLLATAETSVRPQRPRVAAFADLKAYIDELAAADSQRKG